MILQCKSSIQMHVMIALAMTGSRGLTLSSLLYLTYPTQVIFKSMKLLAVLFGSVCALHKSFHTIEIVGHICMVLAACLFALADNQANTNFNPFGVFLVLSRSWIFFLADSIHANCQEVALRVNHSSFNEVMFYSNAIAALLSALICCVTGEMTKALIASFENPVLWLLFLVRNITIYFGTVGYLEMTKKFGAVLASEVTTARKVLTICTSYYFFPKPFIFKHFLGSVAFALAIIFGVVGKRLSFH
ncbi:UDP-galactose transporter [Reticulomyxa filosa]|uniref:UDP-galactose transporter n=1 Tax=Reticulomyxa filosa TaxID=46433 RepID=X6MRH5_RETFI|nr:UDP-galactose transporter [Reticulomyxa filosa]|eukprot:ETO16047.1 UDP-galactose transporter [Reticulomyxa filosa]